MYRFIYDGRGHTSSSAPTEFDGSDEKALSRAAEFAEKYGRIVVIADRVKTFDYNEFRLVGIVESKKCEACNGKGKTVTVEV